MLSMKKEEAEEALDEVISTCKFHSDTFQVSAARSHDHEPLGSRQTAETEAHSSVQCGKAQHQ